MLSFSVKVEDAFLGTIDQKAKEMSLNRSELCRKAIETFLLNRQDNIDAISEDLRNKIKFVALILSTGNPDKDWIFVMKEVFDICQCIENKNLESVNS